MSSRSAGRPSNGAGRRVVRALGFTLASASSLVTIAGCVPTPGPAPVCASVQPLAVCDPPPSPVNVAIVSATFSQYQSTPDFDSATYLVDDEASLDELEGLLYDDGIGQNDYTTDTSAVAPGALESTVSVTWEDGSVSTLDVWATDAATDFEAALTDLVSRWHDSGDHETITVP